jgi:hypothetical protein
MRVEMNSARTRLIHFPAQRIQRHDVHGGLIHEYRNTA